MAKTKVGVGIQALLTGEAQLAAHSLPPESQLDYTAVREAVLEQVGLSLQENQCFRSTSSEGKDSPLTYAHDSCKHWL